MSGLPPMYPGRKTALLTASIEALASSSSTVKLRSARSRLMADEVRPELPVRVAQRPLTGLKRESSAHTVVLNETSETMSVEMLAKNRRRSRLVRDEVRPRASSWITASDSPVSTNVHVRIPDQREEQTSIYQSKCESTLSGPIVRSLMAESSVEFQCSNPVFPVSETKVMRATMENAFTMSSEDTGCSLVNRRPRKPFKHLPTATIPLMPLTTFANNGGPNGNNHNAEIHGLDRKVHCCILPKTMFHALNSREALGSRSGQHGLKNKNRAIEPPFVTLRV